MSENLDQIFAFLRPVPSAFRLLRIGGKTDGGYLVPDDLSGVGHCFSPGVDNRKTFEDELSLRYGIHCHMADFSSSVEDFRTPLLAGKQTFRKKWLGTKTAGDDISLEDWMLAADIGADAELMLQMDIEGAEYSVIPSLSREALSRFRIVLLELHDLDNLRDMEWAKNRLLPLVHVLRTDFEVIHAHPNNCCEIVSVAPGYPSVPRILELTLIRRDRNKPGENGLLHRPLLPHPQDVLWNVPGRSPKHLDAGWLVGGRPFSSSVRLVQDQLRFHLSWRWRRKLPIRYQALARNLRASIVGIRGADRRFYD